MKKIDLLKNSIINSINEFRCPLCNSDFKMVNYSLVCGNGHNFDLSSKGYVNLLTKNVGGVYSGELFSSRREVYESGFFNPMLNAIIDYLKCNKSFKGNNILLLDAGCGEGSALRLITGHLCANNPVPVGLDISKGAIAKAASGSYETANAIWLIGSITNIPLHTHSVDLLLNILSPADYSEFERVTGGIIIKVIPGAGYLKEIRSFFYKDSDNSDKKSVEHFKKNIKTVSEIDVSYKYRTDKTLLEKIIKMTPLCLNITEAETQSFISTGIDTLTVDFKILAGVV